MRSPVPTKLPLCFKICNQKPPLHHELMCSLSVLIWALFSLFLMIWNFFPSKNSSNLNNFDWAPFIFLASLHMTPGLCSALVLFLALCTGLSVNRHGCLCKKKWNSGGGSCMRRRGSLFLSPSPRGPPGLHCYQNEDFEWLCNSPLILAPWISWHLSIVRRIKCEGPDRCPWHCDGIVS